MGKVEKQLQVVCIHDAYGREQCDQARLVASECAEHVMSLHR